MCPCVHLGASVYVHACVDVLASVVVSGHGNVCAVTKFISDEEKAGVLSTEGKGTGAADPGWVMEDDTNTRWRR